MKRFATLALGLVFLAAAYYAGQQAAPAPASAASPVSAAVFQSKTLRCGYAPVQPHLVKDANSGQLSGPVYDIVTAIGAELGWTIKWVEEVPFAAAIEGLKTRRYDILCASLFERPNFMPLIDFVGPLYFVTVNTYTKAGREGEFTSRAQLNDPAIKVGMIDGTIPQHLARSDFPRATTVNLPEMSDYAENMLLLTTGKADVTFLDGAVVHSFNKQHPGTVARVDAASPLRVYPVVFALDKGEQPLLSTLNSIVGYLQNNGQMDAILDKYDPEKQMIRRVVPRFSQD